MPRLGDGLTGTHGFKSDSRGLPMVWEPGGSSFHATVETVTGYSFPPIVLKLVDSEFARL
jgi:hypothetical protein